MTYEETFKHIWSLVREWKVEFPLGEITIDTWTSSDNHKTEIGFKSISISIKVGRWHSTLMFGYSNGTTELLHKVEILSSNNSLPEIAKLISEIPALDNQGVYVLKTEFKNQTLLVLGKANDVKKRIKVYKTHNPMIQPVGYIKASSHHVLEKIILKKFSHLQYWSEWFVEDNEIYNFFKSHPDYVEL